MSQAFDNIYIITAVMFNNMTTSHSKAYFIRITIVLDSVQGLIMAEKIDTIAIDFFASLRPERVHFMYDTQ